MYRHTVLLTQQQIQDRIRELTDLLNRDYKDKILDLVCVLKGAVVFVTDLMRELTVPVRLHFIQISSYGSGTESSGTLNIQYTSELDMQNKNILLVEDILDTGITLSYLLDHLTVQKPESIKTCVLLDKPQRRKIDITPDYRGFEIPDNFVIGYGLDYNELGRNLNYIAVLDPAEYR